MTGILNALSRCDRAGQDFSGKTEMLVWLGVTPSRTGHNQGAQLLVETYPDPPCHQPRLESLVHQLANVAEVISSSAVSQAEGLSQLS
jgi:hypothetical protein